MNVLTLPHRSPTPNRTRIAPEYVAPKADWEYKKIALPTLEGMNFERVQDIVALEADGNYTLIRFLDKRQVLVCRTLREIEEMIGNEFQFVRVHRSHTINLRLLKQYHKGKGGYVVMENDWSVQVASDRKQYFMNAVKTFFG